MIVIKIWFRCGIIAKMFLFWITQENEFKNNIKNIIQPIN